MVITYFELFQFLSNVSGRCVHIPPVQYFLCQMFKFKIISILKGRVMNVKSFFSQMKTADTNTKFLFLYLFEILVPDVQF